MKLRLALPAMAAALTGCAATAPQYYSLQNPAAAETPPVAALQTGYAVSVQPVVVPEQVARPQIVVRAAAGAEVVPLNVALWAGPLEAQIRDAVADELGRRLNVLDVGQSGAAEGLPVWRVYLDVQRFESLYGEAVQQNFVWRLVPQGMPRAMKERVCSAQATMPVAAGMLALVEGHRKALAALAAVMAHTVPVQSGTQPAIQDAAIPEGVTFRGCAG